MATSQSTTSDGEIYKEWLDSFLTNLQFCTENGTPLNTDATRRLVIVIRLLARITGKEVLKVTMTPNQKKRLGDLLNWVDLNKTESVKFPYDFETLDKQFWEEYASIIAVKYGEMRMALQRLPSEIPGLVPEGVVDRIKRFVDMIKKIKSVRDAQEHSEEVIKKANELRDAFKNVVEFYNYMIMMELLMQLYQLAQQLGLIPKPK